MDVSYAGFWKRFAAILIDTVVVMVVGGVVGFILGLAMVGMADDVANINMESKPLEAFYNLIGVLIGWVYFAAMESSAYQATLGKLALGIRVTDAEGNQISFARASGRHFAKILSALILMAGYLMVAFTQKKQGLHDMMANVIVVNKRPA